MKNISLRKFRAEIVDIREAVEVSRRDPDGNIQVLGYWTPYMQYAPGAKPLEPVAPIEDQPLTEHRLEIPVDDEPRPRVIRTPQEAAAAVNPHPVRAVPKPSAAKRRR